MRLRAATRGSELALRQTERVGQLLGALDPPVELEPVVVSTEGDRRTDVPLHAIGGRGVFAKEVQQAVLDGRADIAVHSAKDLPAAADLQPEGLTIGAFPERVDPRDVLVGGTLETLPPGARIATGSVRRRAQLANLRPDLTFAGLRGNIDTRLARVGEHDAVVVAAAALERLGRRPPVLDRLPPELVVPQVGQGALAVECRAGTDIIDLLLTIDDARCRAAVTAERAFLAALGGGCDLPVGAHATVDEAGGERRITLTGCLASLDGHTVIRHTASTVTYGEELGEMVAELLLGQAGGAALLEAR